MYSFANVQKLTLITSCDCNLSCEYCVMKTINSTMQDIKNDLQLNTINSLKNNSFLTNTKNTLNTLKINPEQIKNIDFWGQEPTLTLSYFNNYLQDWLQYFNSVNQIMFSTNMGNSPDIILSFIKNLNKLIKAPFTLSIQVSYDGDWSCVNKRHIKPETIINNFKYLITKLNQINLNYLTINFWISGVLSCDLISFLLKNEEEHKKYIIKYNEIQAELQNLITNYQLQLLPYGITLEHPYKTATIQDGQLLTNFLLKTFQLSKKIDTNNLYLNNLIKRIKPQSNNNMFNNLNKHIVSSIDPYQKSHFFRNMSCGVYNSEIKLLYNGMLIDCFNHMYFSSKENINKLTNNKVEQSIRTNLLEHNLIIDPNDFTAINRTLNLFNNFKDSFLTTLSGITNLMALLANNNQIDNIYNNDKAILLKHAQIITELYLCEQENVLESGSHYLKHIGYIKLLCNGALSLIDYIQNSIGEHYYD